MTIVVDGWDGEANPDWGERDGGCNPGRAATCAVSSATRSWVLETGVWLPEDYYWDGPVWTGVPEVGWAISGDGEDVSFDLEMTPTIFPDEQALSGTRPRETSPGPFGRTGVRFVGHDSKHGPKAAVR